MLGIKASSLMLEDLSKRALSFLLGFNFTLPCLLRIVFPLKIIDSFTSVKTLSNMTTKWRLFYFKNQLI